MEESIIEKFKNREIKAKSIFTIKEIPKNVCYDFVKKYHYLKDAKFFCVYGYGLFYKEELVGCATYSNPQGISALKGWFGLSNQDNTVLELSRLCMLPNLNGTNATSFLLGNSMKLLKLHNIRAVTTLADSGRHIGSIYQVCNFKYYGMTDNKTDFYTIDGKVNPRGKTKEIHGTWLPRTRKHRYCYLLDKSLKILYSEQEHPRVKQSIEYDCCNGNKIVFDNRFNEWFTCPKCCANFQKIENEDLQIIITNEKIENNRIYNYDKKYHFLINFNDIKNFKDVLKCNYFDCYITNKESQDLIKPYLENCNKCFTYFFDNNGNKLKEFYCEDYKNTYYN